MEESRERDVALTAARDAGKLIRDNVNQSKRVSTKTSESDLVTDIDKRAEELIRNHILQAFPDHNILGEESVEPGTEGLTHALAETQEARHSWIIDPIDGTTNFVHGFPFFCVSIALAERGELKLGVVYDPIRDEWFVAEKGKGATLNGEPIRVSQEKALSESLLASGFPAVARGRSNNENGFFALRREVRNIRTAGSAAMLLAYVAAGRLSGFWEIDLNVWDVAAGVLLVEEAGGRVSDTLGRPYDLSVRHILATNGLIHDHTVNALKKTGTTGFE